MKRISQATEIIGMIERGDLNADLSKVICDVLTQLQDQASEKRKVKGEVKLTLKFEVQGKSVEIEPTIDFKVPKPVRAKSIYFVTEGALSLDHPNQEDMFRGPRVAETTRAS